jgi:xanthine dehydrogenase YagS FAD-binding subunit
MKLSVLQPETLIEITGLEADLRVIRADANGLHLGALVRMAEAADHPDILRDYPVIAESLRLAASPQLRNMATLAGNVLQRTRCNYFRDPSWDACNKRVPGTGCAAIGGVNRRLAVLGVSAHCIANYPGDFANALAALGATVDLMATGGTTRTMLFEDLHRAPGDTPHIETNLQPGELITRFHVPAGPWTRRSHYCKVRDRESWDFALASGAVALDLQGGVVQQARIGLGGLVARPWRSHEAEAVLTGRRLDEAVAQEAAEAAFQHAITHSETAFKPELGRRTLVRALLETAAMEL